MKRSALPLLTCTDAVVIIVTVANKAVHLLLNRKGGEKAMMKREVPVWVAIVAVVIVIVLVGAVYWLRSRPGGGPVEPRGQIPQPGQVKEGGPYGKQVPPGAPPFMKQRPGGGQ